MILSNDVIVKHQKVLFLVTMHVESFTKTLMKVTPAEESPQ